MIKKLGSINNKQLRSQSVGGLGVISQQEINEFRQNLANLQIGNKEPDDNEVQNDPEGLLKKNIYNLDERGNIVNYLLNPPDQLMNKEQFIKAVMTIKQNKILLIQFKHLILLK